MIHSAALKVAESLVEHLRPVCTRIEIKGSLLRQKPDVHDMDILAIPDLTAPPYPRASFGGPVPKVYSTMLDKVIAGMVEDKAIELLQDGPRKKQLGLKYAGITVELWLVLPPATWGVLSVIRTGPKDFSQWIVTHKRVGGAMPDGFRVQAGAVWEGEEEVKDLSGKTPLGFAEEPEFLEWLKLGWIEPKDRVAKWTR